MEVKGNEGGETMRKMKVWRRDLGSRGTRDFSERGRVSLSVRERVVEGFSECVKGEGE